MAKILGIFNSTKEAKNGSGATSYVNGMLDSMIFEKRAWTVPETIKYYSYAKGRYATL